MKRPFFSLTTNIVLLVTFMGIASALITTYALRHSQQTEQQYHTLLGQQAKATSKLDMVRLHLSDASTVIHTALAANNEDQLLLEKERLTKIQRAFDADLAELYPLLPKQGLSLDIILTQARHMFSAGHHVMVSALRRRSDKALLVHSLSVTPALEQLRAELGSLRVESQKMFEQTSQHLSGHTKSTVTTTKWAAWLCLLLTSALAAWFTRNLIARPIRRLNQSMQRISLHQYDATITEQNRADEIGTLAQTLQNFAIALQDAKNLEQEHTRHQKNHLLIEQLQELTSALPGAVFQLVVIPDLPLTLRFASPQWAKLMGMHADADTGLESATNVIMHHDAYAYSVAEKHFRSSAKTLDPVDFEVSILMLDGVTRWIKTLANPVQNADGSVTFNGVWLDVTKEVTQSLALEKAKRLAEQTAHEKSVLQASISHEIRTPLNAILGLTQLILKADLPQAQREQLNNVLRASQHLRGIVNEVLDFSKIDAGQLKLESTDFSLESVVLDVLSMCHEEACKKGLSLNYKMAREVPDSLRGDPHRIAQILLNYVNNAIKFTTSGHIHIALRLDPSSTLHRIVLHASVKDTGPGIPADRMHLLFEAFEQGDNSITRRFGGTGLGLTISRALAQLMGGSTGVHSNIGQGSTFWFTAVLEPARIQVPRDHLRLPKKDFTVSTWQGLRVLVVDDNPLNRAVAEGMLHALGLDTESAEDGAQALLQLQAVGPNYYSCVLMDIQMPHLDGISTTRELRKLPGFSALPVIAMTAHTGIQDQARSLSAGMNAHLGKPLLESALHEVLQQWLGTTAQNDIKPNTTLTTTDLLPPEFDASAIDALGQLFDEQKRQQLVQQFTRDSLQRANLMPILAARHDWQAMRAEAHKLTGTAATFGLMRLGYLSSKLSSALKAADSQVATDLAHSIAQAAEAGVAQLEAYCRAATHQD